MDRDAIRAFVTRDRRAVEALKRAYHAARHRADGTAGVAAASALWQHVRRVRPDWPTERDRAADLAHHIELKHLLERAAGVARR